MPTVKTFEDLESWQFARELLRKISDLVREGSISRNFVLRDQMYRAALSIMLNVSEGFGRRTDLDFSRFLTMARGSVSELQGCLYAARDGHPINQQQFQAFTTSRSGLENFFFSLSRYLRGGTGKTG